MPPRKHRIVLDTNIWISYLISTGYHELNGMLKNKEVQLLYSDELLNEFLEVVSRPKFKRYFSIADIDLVINLIVNYGKWVDVKNKPNICRDEKDNFLLALAKEGKAHFLVTGDADLLILEKIGRTNIVTYKNFILLTGY